MTEIGIIPRSGFSEVEAKPLETLKDEALARQPHPRAA